MIPIRTLYRTPEYLRRSVPSSGYPEQLTLASSTAVLLWRVVESRIQNDSGGPVVSCVADTVRTAVITLYPYP